jgi:transcriptional regulator with XRE-family HTH domain
MPKGRPNRTEALERLGRAEKELTRVQQLRRSLSDVTSPGGASRSTGAAIRDFCREANVTLDTFTRLVGVSRRAVAMWLAGEPPSRANQRNLSEVTRLFSALAEVVPAPQIGRWLEASNLAFEGSTPLQVIERGESDRLWRMVWELREGNSGD